MFVYICVAECLDVPMSMSVFLAFMALYVSVCLPLTINMDTIDRWMNIDIGGPFTAARKISYQMMIRCVDYGVTPHVYIFHRIESNLSSSLYAIYFLI